jgi:hypothetical protein
MTEVSLTSFYETSKEVMGWYLGGAANNFGLAVASCSIVSMILVYVGPWVDRQRHDWAVPNGAMAKIDDTNDKIHDDSISTRGRVFRRTGLGRPRMNQSASYGRGQHTGKRYYPLASFLERVVPVCMTQ